MEGFPNASTPSRRRFRARNGVLAATNAVELARGHDVMNYLPLHLGQGLMPDHTVMHAPFPTDLEVLEVER